VALAEQRERAAAAARAEGAGDSIGLYQQLKQALIAQGVIDESGVEHDPYTAPEMETNIIGLIVNGQITDRANYGDKVEVVLASTPFYIESGGQVSDVGVIAKYSEQGGEPIWGIDVNDMPAPAGHDCARAKGPVGEPKIGTTNAGRWSITIDAWTSCAITRRRTCCTRSCAVCWGSTCSRLDRSWRPIGSALTSRTARC
jgi:alanyl-tRNA synthetase